MANAMTQADLAKKAKSVVAASVPQLMFAVDATASRSATWELSKTLQGEMLTMAAGLGALELQIIAFGGFGFHVSHWSKDGVELKELMDQISCQAGNTQIENVLHHAVANAGRLKAVVYIGDTVEEEMPKLLAATKALTDLGVKLFVFHEAEDDSWGYTERIAEKFKQLTTLNNGFYGRFTQDSVAQLKELLEAVTVFATQGLEGLKRSKLAGAKLLLEHFGK